MNRIKTPLDFETIRKLKAGDQVSLSGVLLPAEMLPTRDWWTLTWQARNCL